jgi:hypothetical protein
VKDFTRMSCHEVDSHVMTIKLTTHIFMGKHVRHWLHVYTDTAKPPGSFRLFLIDQHYIILNICSAFREVKTKDADHINLHVTGSHGWPIRSYPGEGKREACL